MPADIHRWTDPPVDHPRPMIDRRRIIGDNMMVSEVFLRKGFRLERHQHDNGQIGVVLSGRIGFGAEGSSERSEVTLEGGRVARFPANFPHSAGSLEDTLILDLFSPPSPGTEVDQTR